MEGSGGMGEGNFWKIARKKKLFQSPEKEDSKMRRKKIGNEQKKKSQEKWQGSAKSDVEACPSGHSVKRNITKGCN